MRPRRVPESNLVYRLAGGNEDNDLWVERVHDDNGRNGRCVSTWDLTDQERQTRADGGTVELCVWGSGHPPVSLAVGPSVEARKEAVGKGAADG